MHPIVTVFLIFMALGVLYYVYLHPWVLGTGYHAIREKAGVSDHQIFLGLAALLALYTVWYLFGVFNDSMRKRRYERRTRNS